MTRTDKATRHLLTNALLFLVQGIGQFFIRSLMISRLGSELTGLQAVFGQIMAYLGLVEGGLGIALIAHLYSPLALGEIEQLQCLLAGARRWYRGVGAFVLVGAIACSPLLKPLIPSTTIQRDYIVLCFLLFAFATVVDYFTITPRLLLEADQRGYIANWFSMVARVLDVALTIMMLILRIDFALILAKNVVVNGALNLALGAAARAQYPWLKDKAPSRSYAFTRDIKFLIVQSIASVVVYNTSYLFLTHYMNLNEVTRYSNYVIIINLLSGIATIFAKAVSSGIGDLIAREDKEGALKIQEELGSFLAFFAATSALTFISVSPSFIELWVGPGFQVTDDKLLFIAGLYYYSVVRTYVITTLNSAGKFKDVTLSPVLESAINLALAFILVPRFGLLGILIGNAIGHAASNFLFYPMICYKKIFMQSSLVFYKKFFMRFVPFACFAALIIFTKSSSISRPEAPSLGSWILAAGLRYLVISAVFAAAYWLFSEDFRSLLVRMHGYLQTKIGKA